ncbi:MAG: hypothetical protein PHT79_11165 [Syntrophomonadaceae bacterium]|nr:hypothetical protein [Dysgonamonadaceae bacterium]MDD3901438.1 hypothetical protein [Dysgonamonadaceae bacterium]MDD4550304.1 hypothetical protein [Syntrophomonadaceae bacterium]
MLQRQEQIKVGINDLIINKESQKSIIELKYVDSFVLLPVEPFNFRYTLWKPSHFYTGLEAHSVQYSWRTYKLGEKPLGTKIYMNNNNLVVDIFAEGNLDAQDISSLKNRITHSYGLNEDLSCLENIKCSHNYLCKAIEDLYGMHISCPENLFEISIVSLLLQNTTIKRTTGMFQNLIDYYGQLVTFDNICLRVFFTPLDMVSVDEAELKEKCRLGYRAKFVNNYARYFVDNDDNSLQSYDKETLLKELQTIKGVGPYTANVIAAHSLRDFKAIPFDSWNRKIIGGRLFGKSDLEASVLQNMMENMFGDYAGLIALYLIEYEYINNPVVPLID